MKFQKSSKKSYKFPFNILICDSKQGNDNTKLMKVLLGDNYDLMQTKQLIQNKESYIHPELNWLFTPTTLDQLSSILLKYSNQNNEETKHTMLFLKTESIDSPIVNRLFDELAEVPSDQKPITLFITNNSSDDKNTIDKVINKRFLDKDSFSLIRNSNENNQPIYSKLYSICSYYNQLGYPEDNAKVFAQRFKIVLAGRLGCGKSTLINKLLGEKRCLVREASIISTSKITQYNHSQYPLTFYDTQVSIMKLI